MDKPSGQELTKDDDRAAGKPASRAGKVTPPATAKGASTTTAGQKACYTVISGAFALLPGVVLSGLAWLLSVLCVYVLRVRRGMMRQNIALAMPTASLRQQDRVAFEAVHHFALTVFETLSSGWIDLAATVQIEGAQNLRAVLAQGQGALILCIHMGNWEALASSVSRQIAKTSVVVKKIGDGPVDRFALWLRGKGGYQALQQQGQGDVYRRILQALKRNEIVGFVMDQYQPGAPSVELFGIPAKTNSGLATIWRRTKAPVVPITIIRQGPHQHTAVVYHAMNLLMTDDVQSDILGATASFNRVIEDMIRSNPEQYFWLHDRYKRRTKGRPNGVSTTG